MSYSPGFLALLCYRYVKIFLSAHLFSFFPPAFHQTSFLVLPLNYKGYDTIAPAREKENY